MKIVSDMSSGPTRRSWLLRLADEPLAQFFVIGLAIFTVDRLTAAESADPRRIVVDKAAYAEIIDDFAVVEGRSPTVEEMAPLADQWIMNETLYREARALGLEQGDEMVRERIMQKLRVLMHGAVSVGKPTEDDLRAFYAENAALFETPERLTFRLAQLDGVRAQAEALAGRLNAAFRGETTLRDGEVNIFPFPDRPRPTLNQVFGVGMIDAIAALPPGRWAPVETVRGWQVALFERAEPAVSQSFEEVSDSIAAEWREIEMRRAARRSVEALMSSYRVERAPYDPDAYGAAVEAAIAAGRGESPEAQ